uniref:Uncharacterized protein n=1 Tax=Myoviridae sp. ctiu99 TaxID=2825158 RepID=A0A8S5NW97_9CAUD|nr:MAG TPA: hypothetical protein [Myoviridae sp. ctiu99]
MTGRAEQYTNTASANIIIYPLPIRGLIMPIL